MMTESKMFNVDEPSLSPEEYLTSRVDDQIKWYEDKSVYSKAIFFLCQIVALAASAAIPVLSILTEADWTRLVIAALGATTALVTGLVALGQYRDNWIAYRTTTESLKQEKNMYLTRTGIYAKQNPFPKFVIGIEALVGQETRTWQQRLNPAGRLNGDSENP